MYNEALSVVLIFARLSGFFVFSPFFSGKSISPFLRIGLALGCSLVLAPPLISQFNYSFEKPLYLTLDVLKEGVIGYLIGWIFALVLEAAAFAGQLIATLMGFSATEILDPLSNSEHPLFSRFLLLFVFTLFLTLDLHHPLLRLIYESFQTLPLKYPFTQTTAFGAIEISNLLFRHAVEFALFPLTMLLSLIAIFAIVSRFMPIFWIGFPLQLIIGLGAVALSIKFFVPLLEHTFFQTVSFFNKFIVNF